MIVRISLAIMTSVLILLSSFTGFISIYKNDYSAIFQSQETEFHDPSALLDEGIVSRAIQLPYRLPLPNGNSNWITEPKFASLLSFPNRLSFHQPGLSKAHHRQQPIYLAIGLLLI